jgi:hypothetical protein
VSYSSVPATTIPMAAPGSADAATTIPMAAPGSADAAMTPPGRSWGSRMPLTSVTKAAGTVSAPSSIKAGTKFGFWLYIRG